jgi:hypothetical protein
VDSGVSPITYHINFYALEALCDKDFLYTLGALWIQVSVL